MNRTLTEAERILGPRPQMTLVVENDRVVEIWVAGRTPRIAIRDYDWGRTDPEPTFDREGFPYSDIHWSGPAWALGLSLYPPEKETLIDAASERVEALFSALGAARPRANGDAYSLCETFSALLAMSDEEVMQVLALTMAETLEAGGPVVEAVLHVCGTDFGAYWSPDEAFFELLRDKRPINAMVADIASPSVAESVAKESGKVQKAFIRNRIEGVDCAPDPGWRPSWMQMPPTRLVEGAGCATVEAWERIAGLGERQGGDRALARQLHERDPGLSLHGRRALSGLLRT